VRTLRNPTEDRINFIHSGIEYTVGAFSEEPFPDKVAEHCLRHVNNALEEVEESVETVETPSGTPDYDNMSWNELRKSSGGVYKAGMTRVELLERLRNV